MLARGYSTSTALTVQPTSLFRVASLSKSFTAAAIVKLVQDGKLDLATPVTKILDITPPTGQTLDSRWSTITLWKLLQHLGGWDRDVSGDPLAKDAVIARTLGVPMELQHADVIKYMAGQKLDFNPGTKVAYSNFGYLLAGRVIEKVSGLSYATYVQQKLLTPVEDQADGAGLHHREARRRDVVRVAVHRARPCWTCRARPSPRRTARSACGIHDANGGWIASAPDLVRWAKMFDAPSSVLNSTSLSRFWSKPSTGVNPDGWYYGLGWQVRPVTTGGTGRNTWHTGSLPGTFTIVVRTYNGMSWAAAVQPPRRRQRQVVRRHRRRALDRGQRREDLADQRPLPDLLPLSSSPCGRPERAARAQNISARKCGSVVCDSPAIAVRTARTASIASSPCSWRRRRS